MAYDQWQIAVVPFPFVDSSYAKPRPVLILSRCEFNQQQQHCLVAMITTAKHSQWVGDTLIQDIKMAGLAVSSLIRLKLFTVNISIMRGAIGYLNDHDRLEFEKNFKQFVL